MRIISRKALRGFWELYPDAEQPLEDWFRITKHAFWLNLAQTRRDFPHADSVGDCTVFNIGGNKYRLITKIRYNKQRVYITHVLTHKEYDKEKWKDDCDD
ncbi:MAG: type II toxin-antitoxin system HigB family toxin [Acidobacteria bacterium]|nr:type II toxin-antitoxin system HigB family toxin [Acidobacteriota bacterium]